MTTSQAEARYLAEHQREWRGKPIAVFNPHDKPVPELPVIYGFNNGGQSNWLEGILLAEDGEYLGMHTCSNEGYMMADLGILEGARPDRHAEFKKHYPDGYRMAFVSYDAIDSHEKLKTAIARFIPRTTRS